MNVSFTSRGFELTDQIKKYAQQKLRKIQSLDQLIDVTLTLEQSRHLFKAELLVHNRSARFSAIESTADVFKSINAVMDKMQKQVKRHKEKRMARKRQAPSKGTKLVQNMATADRITSPRVLRTRKQDVKPMSQDEAVMQLTAAGDSFLIFRDTNSDRIHVLFKRKDGNYGLLETEI